MIPLVEFLRARLDEDEHAAKEAPQSEWDSEYAEFRARGGETFDHVLRHDPARVLREVEAKRRILEQCELALSFEHPIPRDKVGDAALASMTVAFLALPYADHAEYDESWRP